MRTGNTRSRSGLIVFASLIVWVASAWPGFTQPTDAPPTVRVRIQEPLQVAVADLAGHVTAAKIKEDSAAKAGRTIQPGGTLEVHFTGKSGFLKIRQPIAAPLHAPIYMGRKIEVSRIATASLDGKKATVTVPEDQQALTITPDGTIDCSSEPCRATDNQVELKFTGEEIVADAPRPMGMQPIRKKSFSLATRWVTTSDELTMELPIADFDRDASHLAVGFWIDQPDLPSEEMAYRAPIAAIEPKPTGNNHYIVTVRVPPLHAIRPPGSEAGHPWFVPIPTPVKMTVTVNPGDGKIVTETFDLKFSHRGAGVLYGVAFILLVLAAINYATRNFNPFDKDDARHDKWKTEYKSNRLYRFFFSPLDIAVTPYGTFSISVTQAVFWTFIVAFSIAYVYILKASFILITNQILLLLGISGGTALASRINSTKKDFIPKEIKIRFKKDDVPRFKDLISIGGRLNIYKFQMMVFTILTGLIVLAELIKAGNFPEIPDTMITLMGLSNTLYLGNEITVEPVKGLRQLIKKYKTETDQQKKDEIAKQIEDLVNENA